MPEALLEVNDLHTYYGESYVIQGASLRVPEGCVVGLLGRNGMGKTTLIRSILNLTTPARGRVYYRGEDITGQVPYRITQKGISLVPQGRRIFTSLTVKENLQLPVSALSGRKKSANGRWPLERIFEAFPRLKDRAGQLAGSLSGGEQSMLSIGRALMGDPDLLLMDEPSEGLAPVIVRQVEDIIRELKSAGLSILLVEQNYRLAVDVADEIFILASGKDVYHGTPEELDADEETRTNWLSV